MDPFQRPRQHSYVVADAAGYRHLSNAHCVQREFVDTLAWTISDASYTVSSCNPEFSYSVSPRHHLLIRAYEHLRNSLTIQEARPRGIDTNGKEHSSTFQSSIVVVLVVAKSNESMTTPLAALVRRSTTASVRASAPVVSICGKMIT